MKTVFKFFSFLAVFASLQVANADFKVPALSGPIMDQANLIRAKEEEAIRRIVLELKNQNLAQLQILTVNSLEGTTIEQASIQVVDAWKLGDKAKDNGLLLLVSERDRKIRIEVGQGLEGSIPDVVASRIIRETMAPLFRQGAASQGIMLAAIQLAGLAGLDLSKLPEVQEAGYHKPAANKNLFVLVFFVLVVIFNTLFFKFGGRTSYRSSGWGTGFPIGGGSGRSSGGFGGWSGGGGGFSGGGSSGGW